MAGQILVPLKRHDRIEEIIPSLVRIAKPGMSVVFLVQYPLELWPYLRDHCVNLESPRKLMLASRNFIDRYSCGRQRKLAEQNILLAREALHKREVGVAVTLYAGNLRRVIEDYAANGDVNFIAVHAGSHNPVVRFMQRTVPLFRLFKGTNFPPVLLLHPSSLF